MYVDTLPFWIMCDWSCVTWLRAHVCDRDRVVRVRELCVPPCLKGANVFTFTHSVAEWLLFNFMCVMHPRLWANCHVYIPCGWQQLRFMDRRRQRRLCLRTHTHHGQEKGCRLLSGGINLLCLNFAQRKILALTLWRERWTGALHAKLFGMISFKWKWSFTQRSQLKFEVNWARRWDYLTDVMWRAEWMSPMETRHAWRSQHPKRFGINALILDVLETLTDEIQHLSTARDILQIIQRQYPRTPWMRCQIIGYCCHSMYK